jgi:hypothetical protein
LIASVVPRTRRAKVGNAEDRHREDDVRHAAAENRNDADREQDAREREQHVADAHDDAVPPSLEVACEQAEYGADDRADRDRNETGRERDARANQDAAEDVAAERIDAEPMSKRWARVELVVVEEIFRVVGHDPRSEHCDDD